MDDFASRFSEQGYEPHADDRSHLLKALNEQLYSPGSDRYGCLLRHHRPVEAQRSSFA
ncbi:hypothetical protein [Pseudomonas monteilii]|uniref:hypothetical protein n=1 Tax=Pseudomonas monteilii TaxID=76759 RepID=UPI001E64CC9E|nr:hypothetical protein [Pseudomonas monteilii]MCE0877265.1 hypothetical protein [Pseudomonas monteilii]MCE0981841.1 hypothetical protein [Pseudomonas monteilii]MCE1044362.1 hypothetical protein [Pseudomonas monteilii]MCT8190359.1 hypothetical protein [Pseudomonas monteilii]WJN91102.1 hypothetical protein LU680_14775 [Pseudomonas monteilii]